MFKTVKSRIVAISLPMFILSAFVWIFSEDSAIKMGSTLGLIFFGAMIAMLIAFWVLDGEME